MQAAQPDGDFREITHIIFPACAKKPRGGRQQTKINLRQRQAAGAKRINKGQRVVGIAESRQGGEGFNIFLCGCSRMGLNRFGGGIVQRTLR